MNKKHLFLSSCLSFCLILFLSFINQLSFLPILSKTPLVLVDIAFEKAPAKEAVDQKPKSKKNILKKPKKKKIKPTKKPTIPLKDARITDISKTEEKSAVQATSQDRPIIPFDKLPESPELLFGNLPEYPDFAWSEELEAEILVKLLINEKGKVEEIEILSGNQEFGFIESIQRSVSEWQFEPIRIKGVPKAFYLITPFQFTLEN